MKTNLMQALKNKKDEKPLNKALELSKESSFEYNPDVLNIIWFSFDGIGYPVCKKLIDEGNNVIVAQIQNKKDIGEDNDEEPEYTERRLCLYDGILNKIDANKAIKLMAKLENKEDWIVFCDFNNLSTYAEKALELGFTNGLFPLSEDTALEKDRDSAKQVVKKHYSDLTVAEVEEFSSVEDGIAFLEATDKIWVLKGNSDNAKTLVPYNDDPELAKQILIDALEAHKENYEGDGGFILEEKIVGGYEATPQIVFLNGEPIFTDVDIENKNIGSGNLSIQTGAMQTLVIKTKLKDKINDIAFPDWIYRKAKQHKGLFIADAGLICKDDEYYFTEFCFNRFGFDSFFAELSMAGSATDFFTKLFNGENPLVSKFGVAVRALNMHKGDKDRRVLEDVTMAVKDEPNTYIFECKEEDGKYVSTGTAWDLAVFTGAGNTVEEAVDNSYEVADNFAFEDLYFRPKFDFMTKAYQTSIPNRYEYAKGKLFDGVDLAKDPKELEMEKAKSKYEEEMIEIKNQIDKALNE